VKEEEDEEEDLSEVNQDRNGVIEEEPFKLSEN